MVHVPRSIAPPFRAANLPVRTADGFDLAATLYEPAYRPRANLLIHGATAVPQKFYRRFAEFMASRGYRVVTYDYRGIGQSRPDSLRGFDARMTDWARLDAAAVIDRVKRDSGLPLVALGHSFGGQLIGLIDEAAQVDGQIMVASQLGSYRHWPALAQPRLFAILHGLIPATTAVFGYLPGRAGLGVDLPAGVARQWARWCTSPGYLTDHIDDARERFARFDAPTLMYSFSDDDFAPARAVAALRELLEAAPITRRTVSPSELGKQRIGHFGFFRHSIARPLWSEVLAQLDSVVAGRGFETNPPARKPADGTTALWSVTAAEVRADLDFGRR